MLYKSCLIPFLCLPFLYICLLFYCITLYSPIFEMSLLLIIFRHVKRAGVCLDLLNVDVNAFSFPLLGEDYSAILWVAY